MNASGLSTLEPITWALVSVVLALAGWAAMELLRAWRGYGREREAVTLIRAGEPELDAGAGAEAVRARLLDALASEQAAPHLAATATAERVRLMSRLASRGVLPSREEMAAAAETRTERPLRVPRTISNVLVLVGLAATLSGLTSAVAGLRSFEEPGAGAGADTTAAVPAAAPAESASAEPPAARGPREEIARITRSMEDTLAGMQTAFVPALVAVALTIVLLLGTSRVQAEQRDLLVELEEVTDAVLVPVFDPTASRAAAEGTAAAVRASKELLAAARRSMEILRAEAPSSGNAFARAVDGAAERLAAAVQSSVAGLAETLARVRSTAEDAGTAVRSAAADAGTALHTTSAAAAASVRAAAEDAGKQLEESAAADREGLRAMAQEAETRVRPTVRALDASTARLATVLAQAEGVAVQVSSALGTAGQVAAEVSAANGLASEALQRMVARSERESQAHQEVAASNTRLAEALGDLVRTRQAISEVLAGQQEWTRTTLDQLREQTRLATLTLERIESLGAEGAAPALSTDVVSAAVPAFVRVEVADSGRQFEEMARLVAELLERQRVENDARWERVLADHAARWAAEQGAVRKALTDAVEAIVARDEARVPEGDSFLWRWWPGKREPDGRDERRDAR